LEEVTLALSTLVLGSLLLEGDCVKGIDLDTGEEIAIKLEYIGDNMPVLNHEADIYNALSGGTGIPRVRWYREEV
jgi:hypothetical protein